MKTRRSTPTVDVMADVMAHHVARNEQTWEALVRLGVHEGAELALAFAYGTAGPEADRELAKFLEREAEYEVEIESEGVAGRTKPMPASPAALNDWVRKMVFAGHEHGGCIFDGWTATVPAGSNWVEHLAAQPAMSANHRGRALTPPLAPEATTWPTGRHAPRVVTQMDAP